MNQLASPMAIMYQGICAPYPTAPPCNSENFGTKSLYKYACCRLRLVTHPSGPAELLELPWVVSEPIADTRCVQHVGTC